MSYDMMKRVVIYLDQFSTRCKILQFCWQQLFEVSRCPVLVLQNTKWWNSTYVSHKQYCI